MRQDQLSFDLPRRSGRSHTGVRRPLLSGRGVVMRRNEPA